MFTLIVQTKISHRAVRSRESFVTVTDWLMIVVYTITVITTCDSSTTCTCQGFTVFASCSTLTNTVITSHSIDALSSITWIQQTLILVQLTLQTIDRRRTGTMKTSLGVGTVTVTTEISNLAFVNVLFTVFTMPS